MPSTSLSTRFGVSFRVLVLSGVVFLCFALTAGLAVLGLASAWDTSLDDPVTLSVGIACSLITWLFVFCFHVRRESLTVSCQDGTNFSGRVSEELMDLGYEVSRPGAERLVARPSFTALLFGGTIQVHKQGDSAVLTGPKFFLEQLRKRMRVQSHLERNRRTLADSGILISGGRLNTVQVQCRVAGAAQHDLILQLTEELSRVGATVHCDIHIRAHTDKGIKESLVDQLIAEKLKQAGIAVTVQKRAMAPAITGENVKVALPA